MQPPTNRQSRVPTKATTGRPRRSKLLLFLLIGAIVALLWQRQAVSDWLVLAGYQPPAAVAALAADTTMTPEAKHLFYLNKPEISDKAEFSKFCSEREHSLVLGCYHGGESGIYLLNIADSSELGGVMEVTAAHEMLHAAYERLSGDERDAVDKQLQDYYDNGLTDKAIKAEVDAYRSSEPDALLNEMHSIFGTEVAKLPPGLAVYYEQYFTDRQAVVSEAERYQDAFRSRQAAIKRYDEQLSRLHAQITDYQKELEQQGSRLDTMRGAMERDRASSNIRGYNAQVPIYNALVNEYNDLRAKLKQKIAEYNALVEKRNAIVLEEQQLIEQLSGSTVPSAQQ